MSEAGVHLLRGLDDLAVMGFVEVLGRLPFFWRLEKELSQVLERGDVDLVLPIDYPGLNLRITRKAHDAGIPVIYYISPQVWAWKAHRAERLARWADRIAVILPFEVSIYEAVGGAVTFVGHPLLDEGRAAVPKGFTESLGLEPERPILALFPGSRAQELRRHLDPFLAVAAAVQARRPDVQVAVGRAPTLPADAYAGVPYPVTENGGALRAVATAGLVKSGTSTLEAALAGLPFAMAYRTHPLTFMLAKRLVRVPHIALANLVAGRQVVPEFVQGELAPEAVADALLPLLDRESPERRDMVEGLGAIRGALGRGGAAKGVVDLVEEVLVERGTLGPGGNGVPRA